MRLSKLLGAFVLALVCAAPATAQIAYPGVAGPAGDLRDDGRRIWMAADGGGRFIYLGRGRWLEADAQGRAMFEEVRRMANSVEIHNTQQHVNVLLLDNEAYYRPQYLFQWQPLAVGGWQ